MMMLKNKAALIFSYCCFFVFTSCTNEHSVLWDDAEQLYLNKEYENSIKVLHSITSKFPNTEYAAQAKYLLADIYLNEYNEYNIAIDYFNEVINDFPMHELAKKSLFTLGYIYGNYLDAYTDAFNSYTLFINKYPNDPLVSSAQYEVENLKPFLDTIEKLKNN